MRPKHTDNDDRETSPEHDQHKKTLKWLLEQDLSEPEDRLFRLADEGFDLDGLTESEATVANRHMMGGSVEGDGLSAYVEEIILDDKVSSDIYTDVHRDDGADEMKAPGQAYDSMTVDHRRRRPAATDDFGVLDGSDILGLEDDDDIGVRPMFLQRGRKRPVAARAAPRPEVLAPPLPPPPAPLAPQKHEPDAAVQQDPPRHTVPSAPAGAPAPAATTVAGALAPAADIQASPATLAFNSPGVEDDFDFVPLNDPAAAALVAMGIAQDGVVVMQPRGQEYQREPQTLFELGGEPPDSGEMTVTWESPRQDAPADGGGEELSLELLDEQHCAGANGLELTLEGMAAALATGEVVELPAGDGGELASLSPEHPGLGPDLSWPVAGQAPGDADIVSLLLAEYGPGGDVEPADRAAGSAAQALAEESGEDIFSLMLEDSTPPPLGGEPAADDDDDFVLNWDDIDPQEDADSSPNAESFELNWDELAPDACDIPDTGDRLELVLEAGDADTIAAMTASVAEAIEPPPLMSGNLAGGPGYDVLSYVEHNEPPSDDESFDQYLLQGGNCPAGDLDLDSLQVEHSEDRVPVDPVLDSNLDYHQDFMLPSDFNRSTVKALTAVLGPVLNEVSISVMARLVELE
ncbi:MAG: hypothetical protein ACK5HY_08390, partial [Parahaliea sp.]